MAGAFFASLNELLPIHIVADGAAGSHKFSMCWSVTGPDRRRTVS
jgi:hypothetical protein